MDICNYLFYSRIGIQASQQALLLAVSAGTAGAAGAIAITRTHLNSLLYIYVTSIIVGFPKVSTFKILQDHKPGATLFRNAGIKVVIETAYFQIV